jgi:hypothetical protein
VANEKYKSARAVDCQHAMQKTIRYAKSCRHPGAIDRPIAQQKRAGPLRQRRVDARRAWNQQRRAVFVIPVPIPATDERKTAPQISALDSEDLLTKRRRGGGGAGGRTFHEQHGTRRLTLCASRTGRCSSTLPAAPPRRASATSSAAGSPRAAAATAASAST